MIKVDVYILIIIIFVLSRCFDLSKLGIFVYNSILCLNDARSPDCYDQV